MTREDIIRIARAVRFTQYRFTTEGQMLRFAELIIAAEREACAGVCEKLANFAPYGGDLLIEAAEDIRAR
ncbi:hypothetical protein UFOVP820_12 [uncultured Caudovirales phage]|uniref:Uncharacterized protein n=1 Tax=uncultured Caudovirales phage TaxID=2100421 RepID=A0A6J5P7S3_9CAUD|nr:hypothetical protein UFOVP820_12 [uncultured Caudovirales phage]